MKIVDIKEKPLEYLTPVTIDYLDKKGNKRIWEIVTRGDLDRVKDELLNKEIYSDGVQIVGYNKENKTVVLVKEFRISVNKYVYTMPAGLANDDEHYFETAKREFYEETGLEIKPIRFDKPKYTTLGLTDERVATVYGEYSGTISTEHQEDNELIEPVIVNREKAIEILENEEVTIRTTYLLRSIFELNEKLF